MGSHIAHVPSAYISLSLGRASDVLGEVAGLLFELLEGLLQVVFVDPGGAVDAGVEHCDQNEHLQHVVEGDEVQDEAREVVHNLEEAKHNPVSQPLRLFFSLAMVKRQEGLEGGVCNTKQAGNVGLANAEDDGHDQRDKSIPGQRLHTVASHAFQLLQVFHLNFVEVIN